MAPTLILTEVDPPQCVSINLQSVHAVESAFVALPLDHVTTPPALQLLIGEATGEIDVKSEMYPDNIC